MVHGNANCSNDGLVKCSWFSLGYGEMSEAAGKTVSRSQVFGGML